MLPFWSTPEVTLLTPVNPFNAVSSWASVLSPAPKVIVCGAFGGLCDLNDQLLARGDDRRADEIGDVGAGDQIHLTERACDHIGQRDGGFGIGTGQHDTVEPSTEAVTPGMAAAVMRLTRVIAVSPSGAQCLCR